MPSKEVLTFWLDMGAPISLLSFDLATARLRFLRFACPVKPGWWRSLALGRSLMERFSPCIRQRCERRRHPGTIASLQERDRHMRYRALATILFVIVGLALIGTGSMAAASRADELAPIRAATAAFHDVDAAKAAGYQLGYVNGAGRLIINGCISNVANPAAGAMGYHYFNKALIDDMVVDVLHPEGLVYGPGPDGTLQLGAVEYVVPGPNSNPAGPARVPSVLGEPMHILVPAVGFYIRHVWLWRHNPSGMFSDWSPEVSCP